jgi:Ser-tRNA(Ala) deacylase AlaX
MNYFRPHSVKLLKKSQDKHWTKKYTYPVIMMEVERADGAVPMDLGAVPHPLSAAGGYSDQMKEQQGYIDLDLDEEDEEELERLLEKARKKKAEQQQVITWLMIVHPRTGRYRWVTSEEVRFTSFS